MADADSLIGTSVDIDLEGQRLTGEVTAVRGDVAEVTVRLRHPVRDHRGVSAQIRFKGQARYELDLTDRARYTTMVVELPLPEALVERDREEVEDGADRRRHFRLGVECPVEVLENAGSDREYVRSHGTTINISGGGMLIQLDRVILAGVHVFRVHMPEETLEVSGRIIPSRKGLSQKVAVEFVELPEAVRSKVVRFVFQRMRGVKPAANGAEGEKKVRLRRDEDADKPRYLIRREKYYQPPKIRYW